MTGGRKGRGGRTVGRKSGASLSTWDHGSRRKSSSPAAGSELATTCAEASWRWLQPLSEVAASGAREAGASRGGRRSQYCRCCNLLRQWPLPLTVRAMGAAMTTDGEWEGPLTRRIAAPAVLTVLPSPRPGRARLLSAASRSPPGLMRLPRS